MHLALVCPSLKGHLNPMITLGRALERSGHRVTICGTPDAHICVQRAGLEFIEVGRAEHASGALQADRDTLGRLSGLAAVRFTGRMLRQAAAIILRDVPPAFESAGIEGVVVDQVSPAGNSVAEMLGLPFGVVCNALALNREPAVPPPVIDWPYRSGLLARLRNRIGNTLFTRAAAPVFDEVNSFRRRHGLRLLQAGSQDHDELIQVAQQPEFFDFPRERLLDHFHFTGPWHEPDRDADVPFPWESLDDRPMVYASLGTLQNRLRHLYENIIAACTDLDVQLVVSLGRENGELDCPRPTGTIVVPYAPQLAVLGRASAVVTHAGLNTALESLACGLPLVALPVTNDQPGVARRLEALGVAVLIRPAKASPQRLRQAIARVLKEPSYREQARHWQQQLQTACGAEDAAYLLSHALHHRTRLTRGEAALLIRPGGPAKVKRP